MKTLFIASFLAISASSAYSVVPTEPKPCDDKLAVQVIKVEIPKKIDPASGFVPTPDELLYDGSNTLTQYPILYAAAGSAVTNDQTTSVSFPEDYEVVDGKTIPKEKVCKLGLSIVVEISKIENDVANLHLHFSKKNHTGYDESTAQDGTQIKMPIFETREMDTNVSLALGHWIVLGGLSDGSSEGREVTTYYLIRVKNPTADKLDPSLFSI